MKQIILLSLLIMTMLGCKNNTPADCVSKADDASVVLDAIATRTSVRSYVTDRAVPDDTVTLLLKAAMAAPTAVNKQPWAFVVVNERAMLDSLAEVLPYARMLKQAPLAVVPCGDMTRAIEGNGRDFWIQDVSAATENMLIAAHALGLGAVWTGVYPDMERVNDVRKVLGMPDEIIPLCVVPMGYPDGAQTPKDKWDENKVRYNKW